MKIRGSVVFLGLGLLLAGAACNKHNVPMGGECERGEDCNATGLACHMTGSGKGYCSTTCSKPPPGAQLESSKTCSAAGMKCTLDAPADPILGTSYCTK